MTQLHLERARVRVETYTTRDGLAENNVFSVYQSRDGSVWAGTLSSRVSRLHGGHFTTHNSDNGLGSNSISFIFEDSDGNMWFATPDGVVSFSSGRWRLWPGSLGTTSAEYAASAIG